jgi:hypothetical protein
MHHEEQSSCLQQDQQHTVIIYTCFLATNYIDLGVQTAIT